MAYLLIKATDYSHADPTKNRRGVVPKGGIIEPRATGAPLGLKEVSPFCVTIQVPDATIADLLHYMQPWKLEVDYELVNSNLSLDGYRYRVFSLETSVSGHGVNNGQITQAKVQNYLANWNCSFISASIADGVHFDIGVYQSATSNSFWDRDVSQIVFTEIDYNQSTGIHRIQADYSVLPINPSGVEHKVMARSGTVITHANSVIVFDIHRNDVLKNFRDSVKEDTGEKLYRKRFTITPAQVDAIVSAGGSVIRTLAQVQTEIDDRLNG